MRKLTTTILERIRKSAASKVLLARILARSYKGRLLFVTASAVGVIWLFAEIVLAQLGKNPVGVLLTPAIVAAGLLASIAITYRQLSEVELDLGDGGLIAIRFADVFRTGADLVVIPVNVYFDDALGDGPLAVVDRASLHGQFIANYIPGDTELAKRETFRKLVDGGLSRYPHTIVSRTSWPHDQRLPEKQYSVGTCIVLERDESIRTFDTCLVAACQTNLVEKRGAVVSDADLPDLVSAINAALRCSKSAMHIALPLIGSRFARIKLARAQLLEVIIACVVESAQRRLDGSKVTIALPRDMRGEVPLYALKSEWSKRRR